MSATDASPFRAAVGAAVRELRGCRVLSQEELAWRATLSTSHVGRIERGQTDPALSTLRALARGLDVDLSSLVRLAEERALETSG